MTVEEAKKATMVALGITDLSEVAYITQALLDEYTAKRVEVEKKAGTSPNECQAAGFAPTAGYGTQGSRSYAFIINRRRHPHQLPRSPAAQPETHRTSRLAAAWS